MSARRFRLSVALAVAAVALAAAGIYADRRHNYYTLRDRAEARASSPQPPGS